MFANSSCRFARMRRNGPKRSNGAPIRIMNLATAANLLKIDNARPGAGASTTASMMCGGHLSTVSRRRIVSRSSAVRSRIPAPAPILARMRRGRGGGKAVSP